MKPSVIWQKFYKWYCIVSCLLVAVVILLTIIGGHGYDIRIEFVWRIAFYISAVLTLCAFFGLDLLLWIISAVVWGFRKESTSGWGIFGCGVVMLAVKTMSFIMLAILSAA